MKQGGWTMVKGEFHPWLEQRRKTSWYHFTMPEAAYDTFTWAAGHNWNEFAINSGRTDRVSNTRYLRVADVLQADWGPNPDGNISHSMLVSKIVNNVQYLTYHSTDRLWRPLPDIIVSHPGTWWYGHYT